MKVATRFLVLAAALAWACGGNGETDDTGLPDATDLPADVPADVPGDPGPAETVDPDATPDATPDVVPPEDVPVDVPMVLKHFTFRAVGGVSMGANAINVAVHRPGSFDAVGAMGGYYDYRYISHLFRDGMGGGFCPMAQLLSPDVLADINNPDNPLVWCGPVKGTQPWEFDWDFNHFHFDDDGGTWNRDFFLERLQNLTQNFGNFFVYNPDNAYMPPGLPADWLKRGNSERCNNPARVGKPWNYSAEWNPEGEFDLITFCDGAKVGCKDGDPAKCGNKNPDYKKLAGWYDPSLEHDWPVPYLLAVDYNGNGKRDYGEPVIINTNERFQDVGRDGCADEFEDGQGGCAGSADPAKKGTDPNGDRFDLVNNPGGTEGNWDFEEGEPYVDNGLDGVADTDDFGEGNGAFDYNPNLKRMIDSDAHHYFDTAPQDELKLTDFYFDGGVRDGLHALTVAMNTAQRLKLRGEDLKIVQDIGGQPTSMWPDRVCDQVMADVGPNLRDFDFFPRNFGRNTVLQYGKPDATPLEILNTHTGKHIGSGCELVMRALIYYSMAMSRMPGALRLEDAGMGTVSYESYYSEVFQSRRWYGINVPPGYEEPANADVKYPLGVMLPGVGMPLKETTSATAAMALTWATGGTPLFVLLAPDGQCCFRQRSTGDRICNCYREDNGYLCVEAQCKGAHKDCQTFTIPGSDLDQECPDGHFFVNQMVDKWGTQEYREQSRYEDAMWELLEVIPTLYRIKEPADVLVPADTL